MTFHFDQPCKGLCKGQARVRARVFPRISARVQGLQRFGVSLPHVHARACAPVYVRSFTFNPCNPCNPCTSSLRMADYRHSCQSKRARVAQEFASSCKGSCPPGGCKSPEGPSACTAPTAIRRFNFGLSGFWMIGRAAAAAVTPAMPLAREIGATAPNTPTDRAGALLSGIERRPSGFASMLVAAVILFRPARSAS